MGDQKGLVAGAGLVSILAILTAVMAAVSDGSPSLPAPAATTTTIAATTTTTQPYSSGPIDVGDQWGRAALALFDHDVDQVILIDLGGAEIGRGPLDGWYTNHPDRGVNLDGSGGWGVSEALPLDDPVRGCGAVHGAGGVRAAVCGPEQKTTEIRLLAGDGRARVLSGPAAETGHWRYALPSPDGRWVLAQWSGECEVPVAYLFRASGGPGHPVVAGGVESSAIGWSEDGRAVVGLWPGICGAAAERPGTYLLAPATGTRRWIHPADQGAVVVGTFAHGSRLEGVVLRALRELGLESCCEQPSHGSGGASAGMVFEGHDVAIEAVLHDNLRYMYPLDPGVLWFDCGSARYHLSDWGPSDNPADHVPDRALAERAARRLVSRLYCAPGPTQFT